MMGLSMSLALSQAMRQIGGATDSIFPQVEALLMGQNDYGDAIEYVAGRKNPNKYQSLMDFLFCELHPEWRLPCRKFYMGVGPALREQITPEQLFRFNSRLLAALEVAKKTHEEKRRRGWGWFRDQVELATKVA